MLVVALLEPSKLNLTGDAKSRSNGMVDLKSKASTRDFVLKTPHVLKPIILFCTHALRMHDTRACSLIARVLRTVVGEYKGDTPFDADVREFISTDVLKSCINSINDPYFVDMQKDFAQLIAHVVISYTPHTDTPKHILLSLPNMTEEKVDKALRQLLRMQGNTKQQRAIVLELLQGYRSVGIHEQGKLLKTDPAKLRTVMQQKYLTADMEGMEIKSKEPDIDLGGVAEMFK